MSESECKKCGKCCSGTFLNIYTKPVSSFIGVLPEDLELLHAHGMLKENKFSIYVNHRCQHLTDENLCDIYYGNRPKVCREFFCGGNPTDEAFKVDVRLMKFK